MKTNVVERRYEKMRNTGLKTMAFLVMGLIMFGSLVPLVNAAPPLSEENRIALERYKQSRSDFTQAKGEYIQARQDFLTAKQRFGIRDRATLEAAKNFMMKANVATIRHLESFRSFVKSDFALSDGEKDAIIAEIDADIAWLEGKQSEINSATDRESLVAISKEVRDYWQGVRTDMKSYTGKMLGARADWLLDQASIARNRVQEAIDEAKLAGKDTTEAEAVLADFDAKVALAEEEYDKAKESFQSINSISNADKFFREANQFFMKGNTYLRQAYQDLRSAYTSIRQQ